MKTTNLFVELIVTGAGVLIWISLFLMAFFGYDWIPWNKVFSMTGAIPILSFVYVLGIVIDRVVDVIFLPNHADHNKKEIYNTSTTEDARAKYFKDKIIVMENPALSDIFEYNKSRQRVSRGWAFNLLLILIAFHSFIWCQLDDELPLNAIAGVGTAFIVLFLGGCLFSWIELNKKQYGFIKQQAQLLREKSGP